ncbi:hypothetical protein XCY_003779 [Xanthomonas euroxanthea]|uniref:hypothetical protein n=1 Tax=Xanthomonas euroxanthea TaxID=2259622 RepID=UPI001AFBD768|nr:hypothetical protein [Xanthomonas euroxanthea]CAG2096748.1 hypothetical protein XCY_003779 [Xanthomonas euroxanthea]
MLFWDLGVLLTPGDEPGFLCMLSLHAIAIAICKFCQSCALQYFAVVNALRAPL